MGRQFVSVVDSINSYFAVMAFSSSSGDRSNSCWGSEEKKLTSSSTSETVKRQQKPAAPSMHTKKVEAAEEQAPPKTKSDLKRKKSLSKRERPAEELRNMVEELGTMVEEHPELKRKMSSKGGKKKKPEVEKENEALEEQTQPKNKSSSKGKKSLSKLELPAEEPGNMVAQKKLTKEMEAEVTTDVRISMVKFSSNVKKMFRKATADIRTIIKNQNEDAEMSAWLNSHLSSANDGLQSIQEPTSSDADGVKML